MIVMKYRVLNHRIEAGGARVFSRPVTPKSQFYPDGCEENAAFFAATPGGEWDLGSPVERLTDMPIGSAHRITLEPAEDGTGGISSWEIRGASLTINWWFPDCSLNAQINNPHAISALLPVLIEETEAVAAASKTSDPWSVAVRDAATKWRITHTRVIG